MADGNNTQKPGSMHPSPTLTPLLAALFDVYIKEKFPNLENMHADYTARQLEASPQSSATISTPQQEQLGSAEVSVELLREMRLNREARERAEEKEKEKAEMEKKRKEAVQEKKKFWSSRGGYGNGKSRRGRGGGGRGGKRDGADGLGFYIRPQ